MVEPSKKSQASYARAPRSSHALRLKSLQAGRGIAAVLVVLYHNNVEVFDREKYWPHNPFPLLFNFGHAGVEYFFVLSGFIIFYTHWDDIGHPFVAARYLWRRFVRVYPVYWVVLSIVCTVYFLMPHFGEGWERSSSALISSALLIVWNMHDYTMPLSILVVAWTLYHEVLFYFLFAIAILNLRLGTILLTLWLGASLLMLFVIPSTDMLSFYFAPVHLLFGFGMGAALLIRLKKIRLPRFTAIAGILVFLTSAACELSSPGLIPLSFRSLPYGLGSVLAVLGLAEWERSGSLRIPSILVFLGDASYAIYLLHLPILIFLAKVVSSWPMRGSVPLICWYAAFPSVAIISGITFHLSVERPLLHCLAVKFRQGYAAGHV